MIKDMAKMSASETPSVAQEERTIKGELENLAEALSGVEDSIGGLSAKLGVVPSEGQSAKVKPTEANPVVQERITEIVELRSRVRALIPLLADVRNEIDRIC